MPETYADNPQNRRLGRVGMPKGSMPVSSTKAGSSATKNGPAVHSQSGKQPYSPATYADNPQNRKLGRVGMPKGSMPVSKYANSGNDANIPESKVLAYCGKIHQQVKSPGTYADNPQNRKLGRVGMPKGSMPVSKYSNNCNDDSDSDGNVPADDININQQTRSSSAYADNPQNRKLGRVGMLKGSMPVSKCSINGNYVRDSGGDSPTDGDKFSQQTRSPGAYADNPQNRKLGRVGMPKGSMSVSKYSNNGDDDSDSDCKGPVDGGTISQQTRSPGTYADNPQNRKLGRVGMPKGSMPVSKYSNNGDDDNDSDYNGPVDGGTISQQTRSPDTYADNPQNRKLGRVGMPKGSMPVSKYSNRSSEAYAEHQQNEVSTRVAISHKEDGPLASPGAAKLYKDNPLNRRLRRVGLPIGTAVFSSKTRSVVKLLYEDTEVNRKLNRVGKPRGCLPLQKRSSTTKKIPEMLARLENDYEFERLVFKDGPCYEDLEVHLLDSQGDRVEAFDQAMCRYNRLQAEQSWKSSNATKEPPKTQVALLNDYQGKKIPFDELKLHRAIGKGGFGVVFFAKWQDTVVAVKKIQGEKISNARIKDFAAETMKFCTLDHRNIVKFIGACVEKSNLCIVMEYMQMTLYDAVHVSKIDFTENEQVNIIQQVCEGMKYLHKKRIVHCDLKTSNILLDYVKDEICEVKITDFGLSMIIHDTSVSVEEMVKNIGTPQYSPPEMLRGEILSAKDMMKADVYSLALIFLEVIFREEPFPDYSYLQLKKEVGGKGQQPEIPNVPEIEQSIKDIMQQAWSNEPTDRPTVARICEILQEKHFIYSDNILVSNSV